MYNIKRDPNVLDEDSFSLGRMMTYYGCQNVFAAWIKNTYIFLEKKSLDLICQVLH